MAPFFLQNALSHISLFLGRGITMKRISLLLIALMLIALVVSCSTTKVEDVDPFVRVIDLKEYVSKDYDADQVYKMVERFVNDAHEGDRGIAIVKDPDNHEIKVTGYDIDALVGPLAQDGTLVMDESYKAEANKVTITFTFVDAYTTIKLGPVEKKSSQGVTDIILDQINREVDYIADSFEAALVTYAYYIDNGYLE